MERLLSEEEKIRRAEEISERRKNRIPISNINVNKKPRLSVLSKLFLQVIISICIFGIIYFLNQNDSIAIEKIKPMLSEDTDFIGIYNQIDSFVKNISQNIENKQTNNETNEDSNKQVEANDNSLQTENANQSENKEDDNIKENSNNEEDKENNQEENKIENSNQAENITDNNGIGGTNEEISEEETDEDILYIKANANIIKPLNGWITSKYGEREATDIISANHAGVDIGANYGDEIKAAMSGTVELVSSEGDYGNHVKITNGEIATLYAHCKTIIVNQGDYVEQGQKIAEVGSTGRSTGPHLHFEIRHNNKTVDPQKIVEL